MAHDVSYPGIFSTSVIFAIIILFLVFGTPVEALSLKNSGSGYYHGISYGYSINLQSASIYPVTGTSESQGVSVVFFSPVPAAPGYRVNYLPVNTGSPPALFKKLESAYFANPQTTVFVPPDYLQPFSGSENMHVATSIDYVDILNHRVQIDY